MEAKDLCNFVKYKVFWNLMDVIEFRNGAGDGNRTHVASLEGWSSTIELHPRSDDLYTNPL